jgi:hypothetical protein
MKILILSLGLLFFIQAQPQSESQSINSKVVSAVVYSSGAQVTSEKKINLSKGTQTLIFEDLSPNIDESSIILNGLEHINLNSISYETDYLNDMKTSKALEELKSRLKTIEKEKVYAENKRVSLEKSILLLEKNQELKSKESELNVSKIKAYKDYFASEIETLKNSIYDLTISIEDLNTTRQKLALEINKLEGENRINRGKISVELEVLKSVSTTLTLSYFIYDAGWFATYDLKSKGIDQDMVLSYNAKVYQTSGQNWEEITLKLSTANPISNKTKPELEPYYLDFNRPLTPISRLRSSNFKYNPNVRQVRGKVVDGDGLALPGANVMIGSNGTQTDFDGNYILKVDGGKNIRFSYIGFKSQSLPIYSSNINVTLEQDNASLDEVVVVGYSSSKRSNSNNEMIEEEATEIVEQQNSVEFILPKSISLSSSRDPKQFQIDEHQLKTSYQYYAAPELSESVFLMAELEDWQDLELISGEANLYFENSFLGDTYLNTTQLEENLFFSLGVDNKIVLERTLPKKKTSKSFFGSTTIVDKAYEIEVKNSKRLPISILVQERLPISRNESIKIENKSFTNADYDENKGFLDWEFEIQPGSTKTIEYSYTVKYPKNQRLFLRP